MKFFTSEGSYFYTKWKYFTWSIKIIDENKKFKFISYKNSSNILINFVELCSIYDIVITESHKLKEDYELKQVEELFKDIEVSKEWKILISMKYLYSLKFSNLFVSKYQNNEIYEDCLSNILSINKVSCPICFQNGLINSGNILPLLPSTTEYTIYSYGVLSNESKRTSIIKSWIDLDWSEAKIKSIMLYKMLTDEEYELIYKILSTNRFRESIKEIKLTIKNLSKLIDLARICGDWYNAESICLQYEVEDIEDKQNAIDEVVKRFTVKSIIFYMIEFN